jgi:hypothetical protein
LHAIAAVKRKIIQGIGVEKENDDSATAKKGSNGALREAADAINRIENGVDKNIHVVDKIFQDAPNIAKRQPLDRHAGNVSEPSTSTTMPCEI